MTKEVEELVKALRCSHTLGGWCYSSFCKFRENDQCELNEFKVRADSADALESLSAQLTENLRREQAAVEDLKYYLENNEENGVVYVPKFAVEKLINRHGSQEAGKGAT